MPVTRISSCMSDESVSPMCTASSVPQAPSKVPHKSARILVNRRSHSNHFLAACSPVEFKPFRRDIKKLKWVEEECKSVKLIK